MKAAPAAVPSWWLLSRADDVPHTISGEHEFRAVAFPLHMDAEEQAMVLLPSSMTPSGTAESEPAWAVPPHPDMERRSLLVCGMLMTEIGTLMTGM